jgi:enoyl-CoA hydratase
VVPDAELESYVKTYGDTIAGNAPLTIGAAKHAVSELLKDEAERDIDAVVAAVKRCFDSKDYIEGRTAFMEKRKPAFKGQ